MQEGLSILIDPANDHVRVNHPTSRRDTQANPAIGPDAHGKRDGLLDRAEVPVESVERIAARVGAQHRREGEGFREIMSGVGAADGSEQSYYSD